MNLHTLEKVALLGVAAINPCLVAGVTLNLVPRVQGEFAGRRRSETLLVEPATRGHPESPLRWTCKSTRRLAEELTRQNHPVGERTVAMLLREAGYSLQANRKTREGDAHPDRNAQFEYINEHLNTSMSI